MTDQTDAIRRELQRAQQQIRGIRLTLNTVETTLDLCLLQLNEMGKPEPVARGSTIDELVSKEPIKRFDPAEWQKPAYKPSMEVVRRDEPVAAAEPLIETEEWKHTVDVLTNGKEPVFVTGGAGVGKSSMLEQFTDRFNGNLAVVAPTGVAALRVGGMTIHRFMRFGAYALDDDDIHFISEPAKRKIYQALDALLIDEISMCRADLMDAIDKFLRKNRMINQPFGGVRIIMFGDPFQLPPVAKERDEKKWLKQQYGTDMPFFFHAECWRNQQPKIMELTTVFRQKDKAFSDTLNSIRKGTLTDEHMALINSRVQPTFKPPVDGDLWLTLTTTNDSADRANQAVLRALPGEPKAFTASILGDFKDYPTDEILQLKVGAPVMFIRNDNVHRHWVNGTLGKVTNLDPLWVKTASGEHQVEQETWQKIAYALDDKTKKLKKNVEAEFIQIPLRHASAVTIHKSQGNSYDRCIVDLSSGAFASGQAYVGLSRCRTLEGMVLRRALRKEDVMVNDEVLNFMSGKPIAKPEVAQPMLMPETPKETP